MQRVFPVAVVPTPPSSDAERAIERALAARHWVVMQKTPGRYVAHLSDRGLEVTINVDYGPQGIHLDYVDSANLAYSRTSDGMEVIHRKYSMWLANLANDIRAFLAAGPGPTRAI